MESPDVSELIGKITREACYRERESRERFGEGIGLVSEVSAKGVLNAIEGKYLAALGEKQVASLSDGFVDDLTAISLSFE